MRKKISVIGGGGWGTAIACMIARAVDYCMILTIDKDVESEINSKNTNSYFLGDTILPSGVKATLDIKDIIDSSIIIIAVPSFAFTETVKLLHSSQISNQTQILIATKGICDNPLQLFSDYIESVLDNSYGFISGPNFAKEVAENKFTSIVISSQANKLAEEISNMLSSNNLEVSANDDIITIQIASLVKNIIAIRSGMMAAEGQGENAKAWLISKGLQEINLISSFFGGKSSTLLSPAVVGDLVLTSYSKTSRNTQFGYNFHKNAYSKEYLEKYPVLVEGISAARLIKKYLGSADLKLPIISSVLDKVS